MMTLSRRWIPVAAAIGLIAVAGGCGYTVRSTISSGARTIAVPNFRNMIDTERSQSYQYEAGAEILLTRLVVQQFLSDGNVKVTTVDQSDVVMLGELVDILREPLRYSSNNIDVEEFRFTVVARLALKDQRNDKVLWEEPAFTGTHTFLTVGARSLSEREGLRRAMQELARNLVHRTIEDW